MNAIPTCTVTGAAAKDVGTTCDKPDLIQEFDVVAFARAEQTETRQLGIDREFHIEFHHRLRALPTRLGKESQAQFDQARVDHLSLPVPTQFGRSLGVKTFRSAHQYHGDFGKSTAGRCSFA